MVYLLKQFKKNRVFSDILHRIHVEFENGFEHFMQKGS